MPQTKIFQQNKIMLWWITFCTFCTTILSHFIVPDWIDTMPTDQKKHYKQAK